MPRSTKSKRAQARTVDVPPTPGIGKDLRLIYLLAFDNFATDPVEINDKYPHVSTRYARELLAMLTPEMLTITEDNLGDNQMWQVGTPGTSDDHSREEAEAAIDAWLVGRTPDTPAPPAASRRAAPASTKPRHAATHPCLCGCGTLVGRNSNYRPGHDARHAGDVARRIASTKDRRRFPKLLAELPTDALKAKAEAMAVRIASKAAAK